MKLVVAGLVALMLILWLGFPFHESPRFAGSLWGGVLGVAGGLLMLVPLLYLVVKRIKRIKKNPPFSVHPRYCRVKSAKLRRSSSAVLTGGPPSHRTSGRTVLQPLTWG